MKVKFIKIHENIPTPTRGTEQAAGLDLSAHIEDNGVIGITPGETVKIGTGIKVAIPEGYFGAVYPRSGLASNRGLRPANCVGVIDSDYRGEIIVALHNDSSSNRAVVNGERIAQLIITPYAHADLEQVINLPETERGTGGFGSTGK